MNHKITRYLFISCLLAGIATQAQANIARVQARYVPPENVSEFIERETTYWAEVARKAIEEGNLNRWTLWQRIDGMHMDEDPNFTFVNSFTEEQFRSTESIWDYKKLFPDKDYADIETFSLGTVKRVLFYEQLAGAGTAQPKFIRVNFAKTSGSQTLNRYLHLERTVWMPFIKERMDSGKTNVVSWGLSRLVYPRGQNIEWDAVSVDGFETLADAMMTEYGDDAVMPDTEELFQIHHKARVHVYRLIMTVGPEE